MNTPKAKALREALYGLKLAASIKELELQQELAGLREKTMKQAQHLWLTEVSSLLAGAELDLVNCRAALGFVVLEPVDPVVGEELLQMMLAAKLQAGVGGPEQLVLVIGGVIRVILLRGEVEVRAYITTTGASVQEIAEDLLPGIMQHLPGIVLRSEAELMANSQEWPEVANGPARYAQAVLRLIEAFKSKDVSNE